MTTETTVLPRSLSTGTDDKILKIERISGNGIRWAVGQPNGLRGATWRLWGNKKGDVYLAVRDLGGQIKVSFHRDRRCHVGFTSDYAHIAKEHFGSSCRHWHRWVLPDGPIVRAMQIILPCSELRCFPSDESKNMKWLPAPSPGHVSVVSVFLAEPDAVETWPAADQGALPLAFFKCAERMAWIVFGQHRMDCESRQYIECAREKMLLTPIAPDALQDPSLRAIIFQSRVDTCNFLLELAP